MKKYLAFLLVCVFSFPLVAQQDTIVLRDFSKLFISIDDAGEVEPITDYSEVNKVGFFLNGIPDGTFRICNENEIFVWIDGQLVSSFKDCEFLEAKSLFQFTDTDTVFVSLSSSIGFENLQCDEVIFEELKILKEDVSEVRKARDVFREFSILAFLSLITFFALYSAKFATRLNFFISKTFSLKTSAYQFINTGFFGRANLLMATIISLTISFEIIYVNHKVPLGIFTTPSSIFDYILSWFVVSLWVAGFFLAKKVLIQVISGLFKMKNLRDWQMFDLVNFSGYFILVLFIVILWDFILKSSQDSWIISYFSYYFVGILLLFEVWLVIKFVVNSSYRKLLIISYLCATELIPSILIMVWFFK